MADTFVSPAVFPPEFLPRHVAIVMDGNGRWAQQRHLPRAFGHQQGLTALQKTAQSCMERGISVLTLFAFSSENWKRPAPEIKGIMKLLVKALSKEVPKLKANGVQLHFPGERNGLSPAVIQSLRIAEEETAHNERLVLNVCFNYGGRWDLVQAASRLHHEGKEITEQSLSQATALSHVSDPDLLIRTGGELRLSNFLLWQCAYTELYFTDCLWPDFDEEQLNQALLDFSARQRRFGCTPQQVQPRPAVNSLACSHA